MIIQPNQYSQLHDYLTQIIGLSNTGKLPRITQKVVAQLLNVAPSGVSRLLGHQTEKPKKMMTCFVVVYRAEFDQWPKGAQKIQRMLTENDAWFFLDPKKIAPVPRVPTVACRVPTVARPAPVVPPRAPETKKAVVSFSPTQIRAPIVISYRGHEAEKDGHGMLFDHMLFQRITECPTRTLVPSNRDLRKKIEGLFLGVLKNHPAQLPYGEQNKDRITYPPFVASCAELGLLLIPGRVRAVEDEPVRLVHEYRIIRGALNRGQPILAMCAGSWRVWEQLVVWTNRPDDMCQPAAVLSRWHAANKTLVDVRDHCYNGGMIRLDRRLGTQAVYNVQLHDIVARPDSMVGKLLESQNYRTTVNSVHWKAVNPQKGPKNVTVSATSARNPLIQMHSRQGELMQPQERVAEGFENTLGAPIMGLQWHPEGYKITDAGGFHSEVVKSMAQAGAAYAAKRAMLKQFASKKNGVMTPFPVASSQ